MIKYLFAFLLLPFISYSSNYKGSHSKESVSYPRDQFESVPFLEEEFSEAEVALEDENSAPLESFEIAEDNAISDAEESYSAPVKRRASKSYRNPSHRPRVTHRDAKQTEAVAVEEDQIVSNEKAPRQNPVRAKSGKKNVRGSTSQVSPQKKPMKQELAQEDEIQERPVAKKRAPNMQSQRSKAPVKVKKQPAKETAFEETSEPVQEEKQVNRPVRKSVRSASSGLRKKSVAQAPSAEAATENSVKPTGKLSDGKRRSSLNQQKKAKSSQHRSAQAAKRPLHG